MCMTMAPSGERDKSSRALANCPAIVAMFPLENLAGTS
jgi:hypothetical protein